MPYKKNAFPLLILKKMIFKMSFIESNIKLGLPGPGPQRP